MRNSHFYLFGVAVVTLGYLAAAPGAAQTPIEEITEAPAMTDEQKAAYDSWPPDKQVAFDAWPTATKDYYWSLSGEQQMLFWRLTDEDKIALTAMTGPEREAAWEQIMAANASPPEEGPA